MSPILRVMLIVGALVAVGVVTRGVRRERLQMSDSLFWVVSAALLLVLAVFPQVAFFFSRLLGFLSPSNFVFVTVIMLLLIKLFSLSCDVSRLSRRLDQLAQEQALREADGAGDEGSEGMARTPR